MLRRLALLLTAFTGVTGLVYEVAWQKYLATLLGSHSEATAAVLGIFLAGMSIGYATFGRLSERLVHGGSPERARGRLLRAYGLVEAGIGVLAIAFPFYFGVVQGFASGLPPGATGLGFALDVGIAALLIGPPAVLMGATVPMLTQALSRDLDDATRLHAYVYALNTVGACIGALSAAFVLIPALGLVRVMFAMGAINLVVGGVFVWMARSEGGVVSLRTDESMPALAGAAGYAWVALLVGFALMTIQTMLNRLGALSFGSSEFTFATIVALNVLCIALGSLAVTRLSRISPRLLLANQWLLAGLFALLYLVLDQAPYWAHVLRTYFGKEPSDFYAYYLSSFASMLVVLGPPIVLSGATLPLLFHHMRHQAGDLGALAGRIYSWNTVGSLLGALVGGYALLFWLDLHEVFRVAVASLAAAALLLTWLLGALPAQRLGGLAVAAAVVLVLPGPWSQRLLSLGLFRVHEAAPWSFVGPSEMERIGFMGTGGEILYYEDDPTLSAAVLRRNVGAVPELAILNNGKSDSSTEIDYPTMGMAAVLPSLLHGAPRDAFVIGYGTGITVGEFTQVPTVERVVVAEISQAVITAAPFFDEHNFGASRSPKVEILRSDAYRALVRTEQQFDVIASEPSNPWVTGIEMLYSREFLEAARDRLRPGGIYVQWMHTYETDDASVELVLRTYLSVFERVAVWYGLGDDLLLLGFSDGAPGYTLEEVEGRFAEPHVSRALERCRITSLPALLVHELVPLGALAAEAFEGPVHTLHHPILSDLAGRAFFRGDRGELPFTGAGAAAERARRRSLFRRFVDQRGGELPEGEWQQAVLEACSHRRRQCTAMLAKWYRDEPRSRTLEQVVAASLKKGFIFHGVQGENRFRDVAQLMRGADGVTSLSAAELTALYERFYVSHVPFDAGRVLAAWRRCRPPEATAEDCARGLERAESLLLPEPEGAPGA